MSAPRAPRGFLLWLAWLWLAACRVEVAPRLRFEVVAHETPATMCPDDARWVELELENRGDDPWDPALGDRVSYHLRRPDGTTRNGPRVELPHAVRPGQRVSVRARLLAPVEPGDYRVSWGMVRDNVRWFDTTSAPLDVRVAGSTEAFAVHVLPGHAPAPGTAGESAEMRFEVENAGCASWSAAQGDRLTYRLRTAAGTTVVESGLRSEVPDLGPGQRATVRVRVQAPDEPGSYVLEVLGVREHLHWFRRTDDAHAAAWTVNPSPRRWAVSGPSTLHGAGGEDAVATLALTNAGATPWDPELGDRLAYRIVDAQGREVVREGRRTMLPGVVPPGTAVAVSPRVRLPTAPGRYRLTWALVRESVAWFPAAVVGGEVELVVDAPALAWALVHAEGPASLWVGRSDTMRVTLVNVGTETWSPELADRVTYRVLDADGHIVIADGARTQLPADVAPGESIELDVMVAAPPRPGRYDFEFDLVREHVRWYGGPLSGAAARVRVSVFRVGDALAVLFGVLLVGACVVRRHSVAPEAWARVDPWVPAAIAGLFAWVGEELFAGFSDVVRSGWAWVWSLSAACAVAGVVACVPARLRAPAAATWCVLWSLLVLADLGYLRFFGSIVPVSALAAFHHLGDAHHTVLAMLDADQAVIVVAGVVAAAVAIAWPRPRRRVGKIAALVFLLGSIPMVVQVAWVTASPRGVRVFSERHNVMRLGLLTTHTFEVVRAVREVVFGPPPLDDEQRRDIVQFYAPPRVRSQAYGVAAGADVIVVQVEALQQFAVAAEVDGQAVMPFLRAAQGEALYFDHVFDQTAQGRTSDAEYLVLASGHPLAAGALSFLRADNEFRTIAHALAERGYDTVSSHPYERGFWNRARLHPRYGFSSSWFREELGPGPVVGWGLSDDVFLERALGRVLERPRPVFAFFITLSLHHPYEAFPDDRKELALGEIEGTDLGNWLHGMHLLDGALRQLVDTLRRNGRLDDTVVVVFGDHVAQVAATPEMLALAGHSHWYPGLSLRLARVPVFVWVPQGAARGLVGRRVHIGGHIDIAPTILDLLGHDDALPMAVGNTLLAPEDTGFAALADGSAVDPDVTFVMRGWQIPEGGACSDTATGHSRPRSDCAAIEARAARELSVSRAVLDHDLHQGQLLRP